MHITQQTRNIRVRASHTEENAGVARIAVCEERHHAHADDGDGAVEDDDEAALAVVVGDPGGDEHPDGGADVGREGEDL